MSRHPEVKWAQREDKVYITVQLADSKNSKVDLTPEGDFTFSGSAGAGDNQYELKLELFDKVNVEESKISVGVRNIFCVVQKAESGWWKRLLRGEGKAPHYVKIDWDKWVDEDEVEEGGGGDVDLGGMDFSKFGGMGGGDPMGGMGGMGGMEGLGGMDFSKFAGMGGDAMDDIDESDDEDQEVSKPGEQDAAGKSAGEAATESVEATPST
ncbi:CS domain protein [Medicago truncatula]|uniref:Co-chaperone protein p23 n=1 Tax=Medicago truncatula TaxID=3880 RepID=A0A072U3U0_MEDTR|nr:CS domain protein [Medicago truncatula]